MSFLGKLKAEWLNQRAQRAERDGHESDAIALYERAASSASDWSVPHYNLGLLHKRHHRWPESLRYNAEAVRLDPSDEASNWNLGIAATALGDWTSARRAWRGVGLAVPDGEGAFELELGPVPIRVNPQENPEVVWCRRLDPARAEIGNVPLPESKRRWKDVVLNDGEPKGSRLLNGREVPVFDEIMLLAASRFATFRAEVDVPGPDDLADLAGSCERAGLAAEDWTATVVSLCKACSEGLPHDHHRAGEQSNEWNARRVVGLAAEDEAVLQRALDAWVGEQPGRVLHALERKL
jgi:hypothetical protein